MPRKPTNPFGYLSFAKDGSVRKDMFLLPETKPDQEASAIDKFVEMFNTAFPDGSITNVRHLPEADHDFLVERNGVTINVQLAELVDRTYTFQIAKEEYNSGKWPEFVLKNSGEIPWAVDPQARDNALAALIERKLQKHYARPESGPLWLVIFTTNSLYSTEYISWVAGEQRLFKSPALIIAQTILAAKPSLVFDEVWFTNLITRPVRVWPDK